MIQTKHHVTVTATLHLSEAELGALDALVTYGIEPFLKVFYTQLGKAYLGEYEGGIRSLFKKIATDVSPALRDAKDARELLAEARKPREEVSE